MPASFNPPPNWPKPPEGWEPEPGWQPDPAWGPAPEGWNFWTDEHGDPVGNDGAASSSGNASEAPTQPISATSGYGAADHGSPESGGHDAGQYGSSSTAWGSSGAGAAGAAGAGAAAGSGGSGWGGPGSSGSGNGGWGSGRGPEGDGREPRKKKGFFASVAGILTIVGVLLLALVVVLVLFLAGVLGGKHEEAKENSAGGQTQSQSQDPVSGTASSAEVSASPSDDASSSSSAPASSSSSSSGSAAGAPSVEGYDSLTPLKTFTGSGSKDELDLGDLGSDRYTMTYTYTGENFFGVSATTKDGESKNLNISEMGASAGSVWLEQEAKDASGSVTELKVKDDGSTPGQWTLKVYKEAWGSKGTGTINGRGTYAFVHEGDVSKLTFRPTGDAGCSLTVYDEAGKSYAIDFVKAGESKTVSLPKNGKLLTIQVGGAEYSTHWKMDFS